MGLSPPSQTVAASGRRFLIELDSSPACAEWDSFVESFPNGHHEQTSLWGQVRSLYGWQVGRIICREQERIVAGVQVQVRPLGRLGRWVYVTYGPCVSDEDLPLVQALIMYLKGRARALGALFVVVGLPYNAHRLVPHLTAAGFFYKPPQFPPKFLQATSVINLALEPEQILSRMRRSTRRNVRHAHNKGIRLAEGDEHDLPAFYRLMVTLCERRQTTPNPVQAEFFTALWGRFRPRGWIRLFFAMHGPEPVSAALIFTFRDWVRVWKVGWSGEHGNLKPNEAMWWGLIQWARQGGFRHFDFVEVDPDMARLLVAGGVPEGVPENVTSFKLGFGGDIELLPGAYYYVFNPGVRTALRCGFARLLNSLATWKVASDAWRLKRRSKSSSC